LRYPENIGAKNEAFRKWRNLMINSTRNRALPRFGMAAWIGLAAILFAFTVSACTLSIGPKESTGTLRLTIAQSQPRTLLPAITGAVNDYLVSFSGPEVVNPIVLGSGTTSYTKTGLAVGSWTVTVDARDSALKVLATSGAVSFGVSANTTTTVPVTIQATQGGKGGADIAFDWSGTGITAINEIIATLTPAVGGAQNISFTLGGNGTAAWTASNLDSGSYTLALVFNYRINPGTVVEFGPWDSALQVYDNLVTAASITLAAKDFTPLPASPSSLAATEILGGVRLDWTDNANIETGYIVERSNAAAGAFTVVTDTLAANCVTYSPAQSENAVWYYHVRARNQIGQSGASEVVQAKWSKPTVVSISPASGSNNVPVSTNFTVVFSESMDSTIFGAFDLNYPGWLNLTASTSAMTFMTTNVANDTLVIDPNANLADQAPEAWGQVLIMGFKDLAGNGLVITGNGGYYDVSYSFHNADSTAPSRSSGTIAIGTTSTGATLSWTKATDSVTPQNQLRYYVYYSTTGNVDTVANCEANTAAGTAFSAGDFIDIGAFDSAVDPYAPLPLAFSPATTYYFNIVAADGAGNKVAYVMNSATTVAVGSAGLSITVIDPADQTFTLDQADDVQVLQGSTLTVALSQTFDSYSWRVDGAEVAATQNVIVDTTALGYGIHRLTLFALKNGKYYSESIRFMVTN
jgi:hypothetical protein